MLGRTDFLSDRSRIMVSMNRLSTEKRAQIVGALVEGNSIRATVRMTGAAKNTVTKLLVDLGQACSDYQDEVMRDLPCTNIQCDEIWAFCYAKQKNVPEEHKGTSGYGDVWTWTALGADTKLVPTWLVGERGLADARCFINDLASRLANRVQLTTDGHNPYLTAIDLAFGWQGSTTRSSSSSTARPAARATSAATAPPIARAPRSARSGASPTRTRSRPATSSARTSRCGWGCAASRA